MRFIHTADLHLDAPVAALPQRAAIRRSGLEVLKEMIEYARANDIKIMVIAGDLFDSPTPSVAMAGAVSAMLREAKDITFLIAAGNHDPLPRSGAWCGTSFAENVHVFGHEAAPFCVAEGCFVGASLGENKGAHPFDGLPEKKGITVGVFHGAVGDPEPCYRVEESKVRACGFDYLALGHIHKPAAPKRLGETVTVQCGSPVAHGFDESGERSFLDVSIGEDGVRCTRVPTHGICFYEDEITIEETDSRQEILGRMMAAAAAHKERDIFRFRLVGTTAHALPTHLEEFPSLVEIICETRLPLSLEKVAAEQSLKGYFTAGMLESIRNAPPEEKALYQAALQLGLEAFEK